MLKLIGIKKDVPIEIREAMTFTMKNTIKSLKKLKVYFDGVVILSTCNRTEIYYCEDYKDSDYGIKKLFDVLEWSEELQSNTFILTDEKVVHHIFEVVSGFHSKILGEDQILAQIKEAYLLSKENNSISSILERLFQDAISCGKKFREESRLYEIPVSSASISVNKVIELGAKSVMVFGYGMIGSLVIKYCLGSELESIYLVLRDKSKANDLKDKRVKLLDYEDVWGKINFVDAVISCTAAPHLMIKKEHINKLGKNIALIDLALPRDIDKELKDYKRVILYDIDDISRLDNENKSLRIARMEENKEIIYKGVNEYIGWLQVRDLSEQIIKFKEDGNKIVKERVKSFENKCRETESIDLAEKLIKSTSDYYVNRAIKVLKEETIKGSEDECLRILKKIFIEN